MGRRFFFRITPIRDGLSASETFQSLGAHSPNKRYTSQTSTSNGDSFLYFYYTQNSENVNHLIEFLCNFFVRLDSHAHGNESSI